MKGNVQYDGSDVPVVTRLEYSLLVKTGQITWASEIEKREPCQLAKKDFRLTAFGLPEPNLHPSYVRVRLLIAGCSLILIGIILWLMRTKKSRLK
ncbi:MAG: hypothetical protein LBT46_11220 [Planctomycetaceae bacterium]|nr:hypothetical protein [Planctomycetaceae bacterium]